jgi:hypothetical protein
MLGLEATVRELNSFPNCFMIFFIIFLELFVFNSQPYLGRFT